MHVTIVDHHLSSMMDHVYKTTSVAFAEGITVLVQIAQEFLTEVQRQIIVEYVMTILLTMIPLVLDVQT